MAGDAIGDLFVRLSVKNDMESGLNQAKQDVKNFQQQTQQTSETGLKTSLKSVSQVDAAKQAKKSRADETEPETGVHDPNLSLRVESLKKTDEEIAKVQKTVRETGGESEKATTAMGAGYDALNQKVRELTNEIEQLKTKLGVKKTDIGTDQAGEDLRKLRKDARSAGQDAESLKVGMSAVGASILSLAAYTQAAGVKLGGFGTAMNAVGFGMLGIATAVELVSKTSKAYISFITSQAIPRLYAYAAAVWAAHGPLVLLVAATAVVAGGMIYLATRTRESSKELEYLADATTDLDRAMNDLDFDIETVGYTTSAFRKALESSEKKLNDQQTKVRDLSNAYQDYSSTLRELNQVEKELAGQDSAIASAELDYAQAQVDLVEAATGRRFKHTEKALEMRRKELAIEQASRNVSDQKGRKEDLLTQKTTLNNKLLELQGQYNIKTLADLKTRLDNETAIQKQYQDAALEAQKQYDAQVEKEDELHYSRRYLMLMDWLKKKEAAGEQLTAEQKALISQTTPGEAVLEAQKRTAIIEQPISFDKPETWLKALIGTSAGLQAFIKPQLKDIEPGDMTQEQMDFINKFVYGKRAVVNPNYMTEDQIRRAQQQESRITQEWMMRAGPGYYKEIDLTPKQKLKAEEPVTATGQAAIQAALDKKHDEMDTKFQAAKTDMVDAFKESQGILGESKAQWKTNFSGMLTDLKTALKPEPLMQKKPVEKPAPAVGTVDQSVKVTIEQVVVKSPDQGTDLMTQVDKYLSSRTKARGYF